MKDNGLALLCSVFSAYDRIVQVPNKEGVFRPVPYVTLVMENLLLYVDLEEKGQWLRVYSVGHGLSQAMDSKASAVATTSARKNGILQIFNTYGTSNMEPEDGGNNIYEL